MPSSALPSEVVSTIDVLFSWAKGYHQQGIKLDDGLCALLMGVADLASTIPAHLITLSANDLAAYLSSIAAMKSCATAYLNADPVRKLQMHVTLPPLDAFDKRNPIFLLRACLAKCPDSLPTPGTSDFPFFASQQMRDALQSEVSAVGQALADREWKAATVLGGAALEAILFWAIRGLPNELAVLKDKPKEPMDVWELRKLIDVARKLGMIDESTRKLADLARDARNLVHPGAVLTGRRDCDKATSQTVAAAIEAVVRDVSRFCREQNKQL